MNYFEATEAHITAQEAIAFCRTVGVVAIVRESDRALIDSESGDRIAEADDHGEYYGGDVIGGFY
ncbi:hypothetical protein ELG97_37005 [Rhizobium leguminosarum]|uniref:hypothetical protein n=1 Tax=Rhizobium leguminosarum TaxID=384 RepID=UPI00102F924F|nr:hypothetical protein [Rhizobium leguminosarum]TBE73832.1 hypothetical protein ELG97_37005 [Rhizobium leguminosarum]